MATHNQGDIERLEGKMEKMFDDMLGRKDGLVKVAHPNPSMTNNSYRQYRSSFLTLGDMQIPSDYRDIFKWCRYFFKFDSLIGAAVRSLSTFPVTEYILNDSRAAEGNQLIPDDEDSEELKFYRGQLDDVKLYKHLIEIGYDYFLYGNCIIFAEPGVKTVKRRDETGQIVESKEVVWKNIERLDVTRVRIDRDPKTKEPIYYYDVPAEIKQIIRSKKPKEKYERIPKIFKDAVKKKGLVKLNSKFIYHLSMPSESGDTGLWATPPVLHAMKLILYKNVLRQAQEAIAYEHIIPRRIYFFQETNTYSPEFNFTQIADDFAFELRKQLNDPNYQVISPIPVQQIQHGGQGRALLLVPEIEQLDNAILASMGLPREFIFGGVSYSGSTTSLRIVENQFITYRMLVSEYVNEFLIKRLAQIRGEWEVPEDDEKLPTFEMSELKMQDDIQQKQLMIQLNTQGKLPDDILYEKVFGLDSESVVKQLLNEQKRKVAEQFEVQKLQLEYQAKFQEEQMKYGVQPQEEEESAIPEGEQPQQELTGNQEEQAGQQRKENEQMGPISEQQIFSIAQQLVNASEAQQANVIGKMPRELAQKVMMYVEELRVRKQEDEQVDMKPMPEKLPPRREGGV